MILPAPTWPEFLEQFTARWKQGEHVLISAQTGAGKTDLGLRLANLPTRKHSVALVTKPQDTIFRSPLVRGWKRVNEWRPDPGWTRVLLSAKRADTTRQLMREQYDLFGPALDAMYHQRGWTILVDEAAHMTSRLKLGPEIGDAHYTGRALGLTFISCTQRPAYIPVIIPQSASHAFIGRTGRREDLRRLAEVGGARVKEVQDAIASLQGQHDLLYVDVQGELPLQVVNTHRG